MSKKTAKKQPGLPVWITREPKTAHSPTVQACRYEVWVGVAPRLSSESGEWEGGARCEYVTGLCTALSPRYLRQAGVTLSPGGGPLECVLTVKA